MRTFLVLFFIIFLLSNAKAQTSNKIDKLDVNQLKLPKETVSKATYIDATGQIRSSTVSDTELGYLSGLTELLTTSLTGKANDADVVKLTGNQSVSGTKTFTGKIVASSTTNGSIPCPVMTEVQRDAFTPVSGDCVYNSTTLKLNVFDGSVWKDVGGAGGISLWLTANPYNVNDIVINSDKIYRCLIAHTSGTFATDLAASKWGEVSSGLQSPVALADGGTGRSITASAGSIVYADADSFELLSGTSGKILQSNGTSAPSFVNKSISGKSQQSLSSSTVEEIQVPNNQLTQVSTNKFLNETGNNNLLINPSFEHLTPSTGWTNLGTAFFDSGTSVVFSGKQAALYAPSVESISIQQVSTLNASNIGGSQGLASVRVKSDSPLKVCAIIDGTVSTSLCVDVQTNNKWGLYKIPFILGSTSNGISIASAGNILSGLVYIDDAFVGVTDLTQNINACNDASCETEFSAKVSSAAVVNDENLAWIDSCTKGGTGIYNCTFKSGLFSVAPNCTTVTTNTGINNGVTANICKPYGSAGQTSSSIQIRCFSDANASVATTPADYDFNISCQKQGVDFTNAKQLSNGNTYSSTNADTDWALATNPTIFGSTTNPTTGTISYNQLRWKRSGGDLELRWQFKQTSAGTIGSGNYYIELPNGLNIDTTRISNLNSSGVEASVGTGTLKSAATLFYANVQLSNNATNKLSILLSNEQFTPAFWSSTFASLANTTIDLSINVKVPILGWQNSNIIIGQFNGLESCASTLDCTDTFSAKVSAAGVVSGENVEWINGNCTVSSGVTTCNYGTGLFSVTPNCSAITTGGSSIATSIQAQSSTSIQIRSVISNTGALSDQPFNIICQKQGVDYIGKTAKAVASDQNLSSPGTTKSTLCSAKISSTGVISDQKGGCFSSCTNATSPVCTFTSNYWVSGQVPNCWSIGDTGWLAGPTTTTSTTVQGSLVNSTGVNQSGPRNYFCHGERQ